MEASKPMGRFVQPGQRGKKMTEEILVSVRKQPEGMEIDGVFYPGEEERVSGE